MSKLRVVCLTLSTAIVLMHSFTPHTHHSNFENESFISCQHATEEGIFGIFQMLFSQDLGEEHLERFVHAGSVDLDFDDFIFLTLILFSTTLIRLEKRTKPIPFLIQFRQHYRITQYKRRGPPFQV